MSLATDIFTWDKGRVVPCLSYDVIQDILDEPFPHNFDLYCSMMDLYLKDWQRQECLNMIRYNKYLINWGRGMSKTFLFVLVAVFLALFDMRVIYLVPRVDELEQPMQYFNANAFVDANPHKKTDKTFSIKKGMWYYVGGKPMIKISNIDDKGFNVSSGRFNVTMYDECALLMYYAKEVELFNKASGMLRAMDYPHRIWASTPLIGSHFVTMKKDIEATTPELMSWRNFENTPDNFLTDTPEKKAQMEEERQDAIRQGIAYAWETENLALERTALGRAFKNIYELPFDEFRWKYEAGNRIGFDFHGWKVGHIWVEVFIHPQIPDEVYIINEGAEVYDEQATADESMNFLKRPYFNGKIKIGESGGLINDPYVKAGSKFGMGAANIQGKQKHNLEANILQYKIYIDRLRTPRTYEDLTNAEWADPNKFVLHKESQGKKFRNHYLDAFSNQLPVILGPGVWIPNKQLRKINIHEQDRQAHHVQSF